MAVATPIEIRQLALALETVRGTAPAAPTKFMSLTKDSDIAWALKLLADPALRGYNAGFASFPGILDAKGPLKTPVRASDIYYFLKMLLGAPTSTEQASFVVTTGVNDTIDFNIGAGNLVATVAPGTYIAGQTQADTGSLCALIKNAITAAEGVGTYTVTYSRATGLFTITRSAGTFQLMFLTGPNTAKTMAPLIGFAVANQTGALTYTGTIVQTPPFKHVFTQGLVIQLPSYAFYINRGFVDAAGNKTKQYPLGSIDKLKFSGSQEGPVEVEASIKAQQEQEYTGVWTPVYSESPVLMFSQTTVKVAGNAPVTPNIKSWSIEFMPGLKEYRPLFSQQYAYDLLAAGPFTAQGEMEVYFMDEIERNKFLADTTTSLEFLAANSLVGGGTVKNTLDLLMPLVEYTAFPFGDDSGFLAAKVKFNAKGAIVAGAFQPVVTAYVISSVIPGA